MTLTIVTSERMDPRTLWSSGSRDQSTASSRLLASDELEPGEEPVSLRSDSGLNSLECWDYTVELEAISTGHPGQWREGRP